MAVARGVLKHPGRGDQVPVPFDTFRDNITAFLTPGLRELRAARRQWFEQRITEAQRIVDFTQTMEGEWRRWEREQDSLVRRTRAWLRAQVRANLHALAPAVGDPRYRLDQDIGFGARIAQPASQS